MASAKQKAAREKFKKKVTEAKHIQKKNPKKKWTTCMKEAWK
jgi:hypothetical protein